MSDIICILSNNTEELNSTKRIFEKEGYQVFTYSSVNETNINSINKNNPDVILIDLHIDNSDGIEFCHQLRVKSILDSFVVIYTEHADEYIQIEAFKAGADSYIVKPINPRILVKKINALLKRNTINFSNQKPRVLSFNNLVIDRERYLVYSEGRSIDLPRKEFEMLFLLISYPQKVFSREEILHEVWGDNYCLNTRIIDVHIRKIREQIGESTINTVKGVGYRLA